MEEDCLPNFSVFDFSLVDDTIPVCFDNELECSDAELVSFAEATENQTKRFPQLSEDDKQKIVSNAESKGSKRNTKWFVKLFEDWCSERQINKNVMQMTEEELDESLRRFYAEARTKTGEEYSRSSLLGFRNSVERYFTANNRSLKITRNPTFNRSNKMLESKLKALRREGKENTKHKPVIESADLVKINNSPFMSPNTAGGLLRKVWFYVTLYWCRRGCEGQRLLRRDSFQFAKDAEGNDYLTMSHDELTKNHQGGFSDKTSEERQTRLYSTGQDGDAFSCLKMYVSKLNPQQEAFFQKPKPDLNFQCSDPVWYENKPLGVNRLAKIMKEISLGAGLSKTYTNHCVRATAITLWSDSCVPARHIMSISGHVNEQSLASYNSRPSVSQLKNCSDILSTALQNGQAPNAHGATTQPPARSFHASSSSVSVMAPNASFNGMFNSCNIGQAQVFMLPQNGSIFSKP